VAPHHLATTAGLAILRAGGHAVDAAIATNAVLGVVMPFGCGIGGDAFWLIWNAADRELVALNGSGRAGAWADPALLRADGMTTLPLHGPLTITVPGAVRSWGDAGARFGRLPREAILAPAIELARDGFPAWTGLIDAIERTATIADGELAPRSAMAFRSVYRSTGRTWREGERIRLPAVAATLDHLAAAGFEDFYEGELAGRQAMGFAAAGVPLKAGDLAAHTSTWARPISTEYRGVRVATHPPNSSGIVALELLNILDAFRAPGRAVFGPSGVEDPRWVHLGIEASKLAMADRDAHLTDPDAVHVPVDRLTSKARAAELARRIDPAWSAPAPAATTPRGGGTIFLATVDGEGNAVALIQSNYMGFGSGIVDPETGIHYQNRGAYFSLDADHPNVLAPGKRTLHTLMPWMLFQPDAPGPWIVGGSMGGDAQPQIAAQVISALVDGRADIASAIAGPRWFVEPAEHFAPPIDVRLEPRFVPAIATDLAAKGHPVTLVEPFDSVMGHCHAIELVDGGPGQGGSVAAATDPRSAGLPAVW
jgi:gamma-glutamyltranspeptidase/glutathione hydrolase